MSTNKYNAGQRSSTDTGNKSFKSMQIGIVEVVGKVSVSQTDPSIKNKDLVFNADPYIIKCRIVGGDYDNIFKDNNDLPNCFPLTPKLTTPIPKVGEMVMLFMTSGDDRYADRYYMGPIISNPLNINKQTLLEGATAGLSSSIYLPQRDLSKIESIKGIYAEYDSDNTFSIDGRNNADIVFKDSEILLRGGKFIENKPDEFNQLNPAYIQIKNGFNITENSKTKKISVNNIVADKINLLTYNGTPVFNLTQRDLINNKTPYITDKELNKIIEDAHPIPYGDILLEYLISFRAAFDAHIHNHLGAASPTDNTTKGNAVNDFRKLAPTLELKMLSKNIRIN